MQRFFIWMLCGLTLTACQSLPKPPVTRLPSTSAAHPPIMPKQFALTGKIGVRTPQQSGSAFYAWGQEDQRFRIELSGALGIGQTTIEGTGTRFSLENANTGHLEADNPEALLQQATGWVAPISVLPKWIMGLADQSDSPAEFDSQHRLIHLTEQGWQVRLDYTDAATRPNKLVMTQPIDGGENRVTLTIATRQETP